MIIETGRNIVFCKRLGYNVYRRTKGSCLNFFPFSLNIADPTPLFLLLLLPLVFFLAWKGGSLVVIRSRFRRMLSIGLRLIIVALIVFALAGLRLIIPTSSLSTI